MIERVWIAYKFELAKAFRSVGSYVGPLLVLVTVLLMPLHHGLSQDSDNSYAFVSVATQMSIDVVGLLLVLIYASCLISTELGRGTLRMVLVRPILRHEFLLAKLFLGMTYVVVLNLIASGASWLLASFFGDLTGITFGGEVIYTSGAIATTYVTVLALGLLPQFAAVGFALMVSTLTRSTAAAVGTTVGVWLVVNLLKHPLGIGKFLFSTYVEAPWTVFMDRTVAMSTSWLPMTYYVIGTSLVSLILFTSVAIWSLSRRNLHA